MPKNKTGSTLDAAAKIEADNDLRAAQAEALSRQTALDNAAADKLIADKRVADAAALLNPVVAAPVILAAPTWAPAEAMAADAVRAAVATYFRDVITVIRDDEGTIDLLRAITYGYEANQLNTLVAAMEKGSGIKALPRHTDDCLKLRAVMESMAMAVVCISVCPMVSVRAPSAPRAASATTTTTTTTADGPGLGHSKGNVPYTGTTNPTGLTDVSCKEAARRALVDFPTNATLLAAFASPAQNFREVLRRTIKAGGVPNDLFGAEFAIAAEEAAPAA